MNIDKLWAPATKTVFDSWANDKTAAKRAAQPVPADLVSGCVTLYNYERFVEECLDSVAAQTHEKLELLVIDDASPKDNSAETAAAWAEKNDARFHRVRVLAHVRNQGPAEARNTVFREAAGEFVFIIDADNDIFPRAIARLYDAAHTGGFDATYSQIVKFGDEMAIGEADIWDIVEMRRQNYVDVMALVRRAAWAAVDGFTHIDDGWEDYDFWLKFIDAGFSAAYVPEILCRYRVHGKSRTATEAHAAHEDLRVLMAFRHIGFGLMPLELAAMEAAETQATPPMPASPDVKPAPKAAKRRVTP